MKLALQDPATGHWIDPAWQGQSPGVHALVIGVSRYAHFAGGDSAPRGSDAWVRDCHGLGQLQVSALTAWRVFEWLNRDYRHAGLPLVSCHLLLAPQADELRVAPGMAGQYALPTLANCELALRAWAAGMKTLAPAVATKSRGLMFFSGHGVEVDAERQVLLPADYLAGVLPSPDDAIGTENIRQGLAMLAMSQVLLFIDACRNDTESLRQLDIRGRPTLTTGKAVLTNSLQTSAVLYATASGRSAFQHKHADDGLSIYGTALLEGLRGTAGMAVTESATGREIRLFNLQPFVESRVGSLIRGIPGAGAAAEVQMVSLAGRRLSNLTVTELAGNGLVLMAPRLQAMRTLPWDQEPGEPEGPATHDPDAVTTTVGASPALPLRPRSDAEAGVEIALHQALGSEDITELWLHRTHARPLGSDGRGRDADWRVVHVERSASRERQRIELWIDPRDAPVIGLEQTDHPGRRWLCLLGSARAPGDTEPIRYVVDALYRWPTAQEGGGRARLSQWRARLALDNVGALGVAAKAWAHLQGGRLDLAQHWVLRHLIEADDAVLAASPVAGLVAGAVLLHADALAPHAAWLGAAAERYPGIGDFAPMQAQAWLDTNSLDPDERIARACDALQVLGEDLPLITAIAFSRADILLGQLLAQEAVPDDRQRAVLERAHARIARRRPAFRAGGLFTVLAGFAEDRPQDVAA